MLLICILVIVIGLATGSAELLQAFIKSDNLSDEQRRLAATTSTNYNIVGALMIIIYAVATALQFWFVLVVLHCYRFFRDKELFGESQRALGIFGLPSGSS